MYVCMYVCNVCMYICKSIFWTQSCLIYHCVIRICVYCCVYVYTVRGYLPASEDIKDNLMGVDREQEELQQLYQLKQVYIRSNSLYNIGQDFNEINITLYVYT